jgi:hypothetical protein
MPRSLQATFRADFESQNAQNTVLVFLRFYSQYFATPIYVVNDVVNYTYSGNIWIGFPFQIEFLEDADKPPRGKITIQNVDTTIGEALRTLQFAPSMDVLVFSEQDWGPLDLGTNSRLPIGTPTIEYQALFLQLWDLAVNAQTVEATFGLPDVSQELWPQTRCTQNFTPGLFR